MKLIVGLGNPGREYVKTRHNAGFRVLDLLAEKCCAGFDRSKFKGLFANASLPEKGRSEELADRDLLLVKPQTFMNLSGETVLGLSGYFKVALSNLLVVVDDVALPLGQLRLRKGGSDGGHNGLKNITERLGASEYARLRVGIGGRDQNAEHPLGELTGHVLGRFSAEEELALEKALQLAVDACLLWAQSGIDAAMNKYNSTKGRLH